MIKSIPQIVPKSKTISVAVSMGVDSVAAAHYLISKGYKVEFLHFNHGLREQNNKMEDSYFAFIDYLYSLGYDLQSRLDFGTNLKSEQECREARLKFYSENSKDGIVVTGHHLGDVEEQYLLNCFRGHPEYKPFNLISDFGGFKIVHPFLLTKKQDFVDYAAKNGLDRFVVTDETNSIIKGSRRNWIRNVIIPEMREQKVSLEKYCIREIKKELGKLDILN